MIRFATKEYSMKEVLPLLNPIVAKWFRINFKEFTPPQKFAIVPIMRGENVLVSSPTGTGKTLTAFLSIINELINEAEKERLEDKVYALYVSPLRALNNDIFRNLQTPLEEIYRLAEKEGLKLPEIRHRVRTGDTPNNERQKMLKKPPHILITTPESLAIMLNAPKFVKALQEIRWVIVDEIHSLVENKRGSHLALSLERLRELIGKDFIRIGLSATINPLIEVAKFLVGYENGRPRSCIIADTEFAKSKDLRVLSPVDDLIHIPTEVVNRKMYEMITELIKGHRTTLIFTNTRSGTERVVFHLRSTLGSRLMDDIAAHHSSLSRRIRFEVEERLKHGELKAIVSSTSLELGIDIGYIDLVVQIGSPKSVTRALQRVGRAGHKLHEVSKGRFVCVDRDDLVEVAVMVREAMKGHLDLVHIPRNPLDVLAQHILGMSIERKWKVDEAFSLIRRAYPFRKLSKKDFLSVLKYLSGGYESLEDNKVYGKIWFDGESFGRRGKYARVIYSLNIGTIPDEVSVKVKTTDGKVVGTIEEEFLERLMPGDRFLLGGKVYEFVRSRGMEAKVKPVFDQKPTVPSWFSEMLPLSFDLALKVAEFRGKVMGLLRKGAKGVEEMIMKECRTDENSARGIVNYLKQEMEFLRALGFNEPPSDRLIFQEWFWDEDGRANQVFHTLFGRRVNEALSKALAYLAGKRLRRNVGIAVHDNGFMLIYPRKVKPIAMLSDLLQVKLDEVLREAVANSELMKRRFRHVAARGLMILRNYKGYEISVNKQQLTSQVLLEVVRGMPEFPILEETFREILEDHMDIANAKRVLRWVKEGRIKVIDIGEVPVPSPFAHNIVLTGLSDIVLMEDKRALLERLYELVNEVIEGR
jgi:ATP-dependent Lhr-like helicase